MDINFYPNKRIKLLSVISGYLIIVVFLYPFKLVGNSSIINNSHLSNYKFIKSAILNASDKILVASTLSSLSVSSGRLSPIFSSNILNYIVTVSNQTPSITVTPSATDPGSIISVNGVSLISGSASGAINLVVGTNTILINVTSSDNSSTTSYTIIVTRLPSSNALLSKLNVFGSSVSYAIAPTFDPTLGFYSLNVVNSVDKIGVSAVVADNTISSLTLNGNPVKSADTSFILLNYGPNIITFVVTAQDNISTNTYVLTVTRADKSVQTLTQLNKLPDVTYGVADIDLTVYFSSSALPPNNPPIIFTSSDNSVAQIVNNKIHVVGVGKGYTKIKAYANSNSFYYASDTITTTLNVTKASQRIISPTIIPTLLKGGNLDLSGFKSTSGLPVSYNISDTQIVDTIKFVIDENGDTTQKIITKGILNALKLGTITLTVNQTGNDNINAAIPVVVDITVDDSQGDDLIIHPVVTPNGDNRNDFFLIEGLSNYKSNSVSIANPYGTLVYTTNNYNNNTIRFDGHINGQYLPSGTYFYFIEYISVSGEKRHKTGYIVLKY